MTGMRAWVAGGAVWLVFVLPMAIVGTDHMSHGLSVALTWGAIFGGGGTAFAIENADWLFPRRKR